MTDSGKTKELPPDVPPKVEYFKFPPSQTRYHRVMALAHERDCPWQEIIRNAIDFYLEFQEAQTKILTIG